MPDTPVRAWSERIVIPTYPAGAPDTNPMFLEKRVYQGSSGVVYPHPVIDRISDHRADRAYTALFLENRYLKIMVLPEIGGRVQMALDKTNDRHFVYFNRVIKPALVGLAGPWISGGIEFNWPQHHRPSTFAPLDWRIEVHDDGSATVWCAEIERMFRTKGTHGFTLRPDRAALEVNVRLSNRTGEPQTFLWWANPAIAAHDDYQSVFPPDVHAVMDHGKRDVSTFPIATGTYYKVDYAPGTDISRFANIPVPTSYMAYHSDYDFIGTYDHRDQAGMLHVANHHIAPGKKQWTWGHGDFGQAWDRQLTDDDGPYVELMCGVFTDNQPDFAWIQPGEEKRFTQVFMPYKGIGPASNATRDAAVSLRVEAAAATFGAYVSEPRAVEVRLLRDGRALLTQARTLSPATFFLTTLPLPAGTQAHELTVEVRAADGRVLASFTPTADDPPAVPEPATPARPPREIASNEELYLNGLHLEQYRHATYAPEPYYREALRRDPLDSRCNNALGLLLLRRGRFAEAETHFRNAIERLTHRNPNPYDGEPHYNLGRALQLQGRLDEAFDALYKATWNADWRDAAGFELARLAARARRRDEALDLVDDVLTRNTRHHRARHLRIALLRHLGRHDDAVTETATALDHDPLEYGALWERTLLLRDQGLRDLTRNDVHTYVEIALDYAHAGLFDDAAELLRHAPGSDPMAMYTLGWVLTQGGRPVEAAEAWAEARRRPSDYCFPNRVEDIAILEAAMRADPRDARAPYYLGLFWYAHRRPDEAIECWERARTLEPAFPTVHRNLGLAYFNHRQDPATALRSFETAFELDPTDARVLFELDQLYKRCNRPPSERLTLLERHEALVAQRDDLTLERVTLLNLLGEPQRAYELLMGRRFHPWEGGEGKVTGQYVASLLALARRALEQADPTQAIEYLERASAYPENLGEGMLPTARHNDVSYCLGQAYEALGDSMRAREHYERASTGSAEPTSARYYNDQPPEMVFYQGLALRALGRAGDAVTVFQRLVDHGNEHLDDDVAIDYFAVSLPDFLVFDEDLGKRNKVHCHYLLALGHAGLGGVDLAREHVERVLALDASHHGAVVVAAGS